jgi:hypothetical protein
MFPENPSSRSRVVLYGLTDISQMIVPFRKVTKAPKKERAELNLAIKSYYMFTLLGVTLILHFIKSINLSVRPLRVRPYTSKTHKP